jgi:hypothetical protein
MRTFVEIKATYVLKTIHPNVDMSQREPKGENRQQKKRMNTTLKESESV